MATAMRVLLEIGTKGRRVVAAATDWPGLDRWGKDEDAALEKLASYVPRYAPVAERAGLAPSFAHQRTLEVVERYRGSSSTDYWGIAHVPSGTEHAVLPAEELDRRLKLLVACWGHFDDVAARISADLRSGPRGPGWTRDEIIRHVHANEAQQFSRKVEVRTPREVVLTPDGRAVHRSQVLDAIRARNAEGRIAGRTWPIQFLVRRTAQHLMDHAWDMEDRDLTEDRERYG
jgi:hypothetical protein